MPVCRVPIYLSTRARACCLRAMRRVWAPRGKWDASPPPPPLPTAILTRVPGRWSLQRWYSEAAAASLAA
eukprot:scaffold454_cov124-Isochrysis_galbana.AAC.7